MLLDSRRLKIESNNARRWLVCGCKSVTARELKRKSGASPVRSRHCNWRDALPTGIESIPVTATVRFETDGKAEERRYQPSARRPARGYDPAALRGTSGRTCLGISRGFLTIGPPPLPDCVCAAGFSVAAALDTSLALLRRAGILLLRLAGARFPPIRQHHAAACRCYNPSNLPRLNPR